MKVGDLVKRKVPLSSYLPDLQEDRVLGLVVALGHSGNPRHPTASILCPPSGNQYEIARSLLEVVNEGR